MTEGEKILGFLDEYFSTASQEEIESDIALVNKLIGSNGISFDGYLENLNEATAYSLVETGLCDDIAYADLFNNSIRPVQMGESIVTVLLQEVKIPSPLNTQNISLKAGESSYAMAA